MNTTQSPLYQRLLRELAETTNTMERQKILRRLWWLEQETKANAA